MDPLAPPSQPQASPLFIQTAPFASIPLQLSLGSPLTVLFSFLNMYLHGRPSSSLVSRPYAVSLLPHGSLSLLYKAFLRPLLTCVSPEWFPLLSNTNSTKLERLHRAAGRTITGCLSSSSIPLFCRASPPPLRITLTHFALCFHERVFRLLTSFPISGLARLGVKQRLSRSSWRAFASTHSLMLFPTSPRKVLFVCPPSPP